MKATLIICLRWCITAAVRYSAFLHVNICLCWIFYPFFFNEHLSLLSPAAPPVNTPQGTYNKTSKSLNPGSIRGVRTAAADVRVAPADCINEQGRMQLVNKTYETNEQKPERRKSHEVIRAYVTVWLRAQLILKIHGSRWWIGTLCCASTNKRALPWFLMCTPDVFCLRWAPVS